jgi:hypothetical protein
VADGLGEAEADGALDGDGVSGAPLSDARLGGGAAEVEVPPVVSATTATTPIRTIAVVMPTTTARAGRCAHPAARCRGR